MSDLPEEAIRAVAEAMQEEEDTRTYPSNLTLARIALEAAEPLRAQREEEIRADERRQVAEQIRELAKWEMEGGFVNAFAFKDRHDRLAHIATTHLSMAFQALADEIETPPARQIGEGRADT